MSDYQVFNAILFVAANGCRWRALPKEAEKEIKSVDGKLQELEKEQKQNEENLSATIKQFNEKSLVKSFKQYIVDLISLVEEYEKAAQTTEEKNKFQKIGKDLEKQIGLIK